MAKVNRCKTKSLYFYYPNIFILFSVKVKPKRFGETRAKIKTIKVRNCYQHVLYFVGAIPNEFSKKNTKLPFLSSSCRNLSNAIFTAILNSSRTQISFKAPFFVWSAIVDGNAQFTKVTADICIQIAGGGALKRG